VEMPQDGGLLSGERQKEVMWEREETRGYSRDGQEGEQEDREPHFYCGHNMVQDVKCLTGGSNLVRTGMRRLPFMAVEQGSVED